MYETIRKPHKMESELINSYIINKKNTAIRIVKHFCKKKRNILVVLSDKTKLEIKKSSLVKKKQISNRRINEIL